MYCVIYLSLVLTTPKDVIKRKRKKYANVIALFHVLYFIFSNITSFFIYQDSNQEFRLSARNCTTLSILGLFRIALGKMILTERNENTRLYLILLDRSLPQFGSTSCYVYIRFIICKWPTALHLPMTPRSEPIMIKMHLFTWEESTSVWIVSLWGVHNSCRRLKWPVTLHQSRWLQ